jgi:hypothetical protein
VTARVEAGQRIRHVLDVGPWLLAGNDDAPAPGRVLVVAGCAGCELGARFALWAGVWHVEHDHGRPWTAHLVALGDPAPVIGQASADRKIAAPDDDAGALAAGLVDAFTH